MRRSPAETCPARAGRGRGRGGCRRLRKGWGGRARRRPALVRPAGLLIYALREWFGQARSYPSSADAFLGGAFLLLLAALADEFRLVNPMLTTRQRLGLAGTRRVLLGGGLGGGVGGPGSRPPR